MQLTILGASSAAQNPGGACSSYLVRQGETVVVIDMGNGAFANLQRHVAPDEVDAVVISHTHADHTLDLLPYRYWLAFQGKAPRRRPRLWLPPGGHDTVLAVSGLQDPSREFYSSYFEVAEYDPARPISVGPLEIAFQAMRHVSHTYGMRVRGDGLLAYSADTGPCDAVAEVARDADLFLCENANEEESDFPLHLKPSQAGVYGREAGARRLVLTHRWHRSGFDVAARAAATAFGGPVSVAREGDTYLVAR